MEDNLKIQDSLIDDEDQIKGQRVAKNQTILLASITSLLRKLQLTEIDRIFYTKV